MTSQIPQAIDEYADAFEKVYGELDRKRSEEQMWLQVVEEAAGVAEAVREVNYVEMISHLVNTFCWVCGFVAKCRSNPGSIFHFKNDFSSIIWKKYPKICPQCMMSRCQCLIKKREINRRSKEEKNEIYEKVAEIARKSIKDRVKNLDRLVGMFDEIFSPNYSVMPIEEVTFHFTEEVGEVAEQVRELRALNMISISDDEKKRRREQVIIEFCREIADVFSWTCGILIKINYMIKNVNNVMSKFKRSKTDYEKITFSEILRKYYMPNRKFICRTCKHVQCKIEKHVKLYQFRV